MAGSRHTPACLVRITILSAFLPATATLSVGLGTILRRVSCSFQIYLIDSFGLVAVTCNVRAPFCGSARRWPHTSVHIATNVQMCIISSVAVQNLVSASGLRRGWDCNYCSKLKCALVLSWPLRDTLGTKRKYIVWSLSSVTKLTNFNRTLS